MSGCLGDLVREVEKFEVHVGWLFDNAAAREMSLGDEGWKVRERVPRKEVFIG